MKYLFWLAPYLVSVVGIACLMLMGWTLYRIVKTLYDTIAWLATML